MKNELWLLLAGLTIGFACKTVVDRQSKSNAAFTFPDFTSVALAQTRGEFDWKCEAAGSSTSTPRPLDRFLNQNSCIPGSVVLIGRAGDSTEACCATYR